MHNNIKTENLVLRLYRLSDASRVQELAGDKRISEMTANIPHPYLDGMAENWITNQKAEMEAGKSLTFAVTLKNSGQLIGTVGLTQITDSFSNLGYWLGNSYWGNGYCTEAANALIKYFFNHQIFMTVFSVTLQHENNTLPQCM